MSWYENIQQSEQYCEDTLATASHYLLSRQQPELGLILALSSLEVWESWEFDYFNSDEAVKHTPYTYGSESQSCLVYECYAALQVEPFLLPDIDIETKDELRQAIQISLAPINGIPAELKHFHIVVKRVNASETWRKEINDLLEEGKSLNQGKFIREEDLVSWNKLRFASMEEMLVARALEEVKKKGGNALKLIYFPNCLARTLVDNATVTQYPDFLINVNGTWGILEVNGTQHNRPDQAERDNNRRNRFALAGLPMWSYSAEEVRMGNGSGAEKVVYKFLDQLKNHRRS